MSQRPAETNATPKPDARTKELIGRAPLRIPPKRADHTRDKSPGSRDNPNG